MKPTRPKIHILDVDEPLFAFRDLVCRCHIVLHNAEVKYLVQQDVRECMLAPIGMCQACWEDAPTGDRERRYEYGLVEAQEARDVVPEEAEAVA